MYTHTHVYNVRECEVIMVIRSDAITPTSIVVRLSKNVCIFCNLKGDRWNTRGGNGQYVTQGYEYGRRWQQIFVSSSGVREAGSKNLLRKSGGHRTPCVTSTNLKCPLGFFPLANTILPQLNDKT